MLRINIDLVPFGDEGSSRKVGQMVIGNIYTRNDNTADYIYAYKDNCGDDKYGSVSLFPRDDGVWSLVSRCLNDTDGIISEDDEELLRSKFLP